MLKIRPRRECGRPEPIARGALGATDLGVAHLFGDLSTQLRSILMPAHGGDVEPLVRLHQINPNACTGGIDHAKAEAIVGVCWFGAPRRHFHTRHFGSPYFSGWCAPRGQPSRPCCADDVVRTARSSG